MYIKVILTLATISTQSLLNDRSFPFFLFAYLFNKYLIYVSNKNDKLFMSYIQ